MLSVFVLLVLLGWAFLAAHVITSNKFPLWPSVLVLLILETVRLVPLR